jgi:hypothetical protein
LDNIIQILPKEATVSITADSWYGSLRYLLSNKLKHVTLALGGNSDVRQHIEFFSHGLKFHEFRAFKRGNLIVTLWQNNELVCCGSTEFTIEPQTQMSLEQ